jgi:class 3 adenylate cyclase
MLRCAHCGGDNPPDARFCNSCGNPLTPTVGRPAEHRKTVTVLFCDVTGSTSLGEAMDAEPLRALLARYFERMKQIIELHGGTVEKFIGDAVMAVFGVPAVHEDDALRACRAALEMRDAFSELGVSGRIGITTGEVVTGTGERLATGDPVNVAARLEQAATPGEILVGAETVRRARASIEVEPVQPLQLKGKARPVAAFRLRAAAMTRPQRPQAPFVGRATELSALRAAWDRACKGRSCELVTVVGPAGVGKSRLAEELLANIDGRVARGRCLPYGEGITYWPVLEVLRQLTDVEVEPRVAEALSPAAGSRQITASEQIPWAVRKVFEAAAEKRPLAVLFDDIQWGEEGFLAAVEHVALLAVGGPILLVCLARPELQDLRPDWPGVIRLEPLDSDDSVRLIDNQLGGREIAENVRDRIVAAAAGNPLFVEEMVAMLEETAGDDVSVPPTIQALLAARLDQLDPGERRVLERAAVEGEIFHLGALRSFLDEEVGVTTRLTTLVRKDLIHPEPTQVPGDDAFRFRHLLLRDAAYESLPKSARADLHRRYAAWLDQLPPEAAETEELAGYHLERAHDYLVELGAARDESDLVAEAAARKVESAGSRALDRGDLHAAANLLGRAYALIGDDPRRLVLMPDLASSLRHLGQLQRADDLLAAALQDEKLERGSPLEVALRFEHLAVRYFLEAEGVTPQILSETERMLPILEADGANSLLAGALEVVALARLMQCDFTEMRSALEQALVHARRAGKERDVTEILLWIQLTLHHGPAPVADGIARCDEILSDPTTSALAEAGALATSGLLRAMSGDLLEGRARVTQARGLFDEWGIYVDGSASALAHCVLELLAGDPAAAVLATEATYDELLRLGEKAYLSTLAGAHALALCRAGRPAEAREVADTARRATASEDVGSNILWRASRALVLAADGRTDEALASADEAVGLADRTDAYLWRVFALETRADVLLAIGRIAQADDALGRAQVLHFEKGNVLSATKPTGRRRRGSSSP